MFGRGLFPADAAKAPVTGLLPKCGACGLDRLCNSPKMPVSGEGRKGILIIESAPTVDDDREGVWSVGKPGQYLRRVLDKNGMNLDRDCWKTGALICNPQGEREPTADEIDYCRPSLSKIIRELQPRHIMPLGKSAVTSLLAPLWREAVGDITQWVGWKIPLQTHNAWVTPNYHPNDVLEPANDREGRVVKVWFDRYLAQAVTLQGRPWEVVPDYESEVRILMDPEAVAKWIYEKMELGGVFSFDYETDRLKPDHLDAQIVCCSICWVRGGSRETITYPWVGAAILATGQLLRSDHPKIGANNKFENRWTLRFFGFMVVNFVHDITLHAHILDNRKNITSLKFQSFIRVGIPDWSYSIKQYLESENDGGNERNRIREADKRKLLLYCGIDSLLAYLVAVDQKKELVNA